jgi:hypothetical protein
MTLESTGKIPGWFIGVMMLCAGAVTAWVVRKKLDVAPPATAAATLDGAGTAAAAPSQPALSLAQAPPGPRQAPPLEAGATSRHEDRGPCTLCHAVFAPGRRPVPPLAARSSLAHPYRGGVCINCHRVTTRAASAVPAAVSSLPRPAAPREVGALPSLALGAPAAPAAPAWLGLQVAALDAESALRSGVPPGLRGVLVASASAEAAAAGLRPGDLLVSLDGGRIVDLEQFSAATRRGTSPGGLLEVVRSGTLYRLFLGKADPPSSAASQQSSAGPGGPAGEGAR